MRRHLVQLLPLLLLAACGEEGEAIDISERYESDPIEREVEEPLDYFDGEYPEDFVGPTPIAELRALYNADVDRWLGFAPGDAYPVSGDCDFKRENNAWIPQAVAELPTVIEGRVTLHPRYYQKVEICGQDAKFYGGFFLEDATGGILVLKDSRIADFTFGDTVRLRVRGILRYYDTYAVVTFDEQEVIERGGSIAYEPVGMAEAPWELGPEHVGRTIRVCGRVTGLPSNANFNEMNLVHPDFDGEEGRALVRYTVSLDRELGQRPLGIEEGQRYLITGPAIFSYSTYQIVIARKGQLEPVETCPGEGVP